MNIGSIISGIISPITNVFTKREERKTVKIQANGKLALAKTNNQKEITLTDQEWESISAGKQDSTWKDEYVTVVCTSPYTLIVIGSIAAAFGYPMLLSGALSGIKELKSQGVDVGHMIEVVVYAAVGLKMWRGR